MTERILTHELLKTLIHYDAETGIFTRIKSRNKNSIGVIEIKGLTNGYATIKILGQKYPAHRVAWCLVHGVWPKEQIDHINRIKNDNRLVNLREASNSENSKNVGIKNINSSGIKGVSYDKANNKWLSQIRIHGKKVNLGRFKTPQEASEVYEAYAKQHHGEFYYKAAA